MAVTVQDILDDHTDDIRLLAEELRQLVREVLPDVAERAYPGWHGIGFRHPTAGYIGGIFPRRDDVALLFEHGHLLDDPEELFSEGEGQTRRILLKPGDTIPRAGIAALLDAAVAIR